MSNRQKYMFETAFDAQEAGGNAKPLPTHTDEDLDKARDEAFHAGHEAALVAARELEERQIKELFEVISQRVDALTATRAEDSQQLAAQATDVAIAICRKILPELARRHAMAEIEALIGDCLASMPEEPRIVVRVADQLVDQLQQRVDAITNGFEGKLVLFGDDEMAETDCAVVWADGGTERNLARLWQDLEQSLARLGVGSSVVAPAPAAVPDNHQEADIAMEQSDGAIAESTPQSFAEPDAAQRETPDPSAVSQEAPPAAAPTL